MLIAAAALSAVGVVLVAALRRRASRRPVAAPVLDGDVTPPAFPDADDATFHGVFDFHAPLPGTPVLPDFSTWTGLALQGPKVANLSRARTEGPELEARAVVCALIAVPGHLAHEPRRARLVVEDVETGERRGNALEALCQGPGISISPARSYAGPPVPVTEERLRTPSHTHTGVYVNPNLALLGLSSGRRYRAWLALDDVRSNVIEFETTGDPDT